MAWQSVDSGWIHSVDYRPEEMTLYVRFKDRRGRIVKTARYDNVDPGRGFGLLNATSKGVYFHQSGLYARPYTTV